MIQTICILTWLFGDFSLKRTIPLTVEPAMRHPLMNIDSKENIWYQDYWGHSITKMSPAGTVMFQLKGPGKGPGELEKPICFTLLDQDQVLVVLHRQTRLMAYSADSGKFLREISKFYLAIRLFPWNKDIFLAVKNPSAVSGPGFEFYNCQKAKPGKSWYRRSSNRSAFTDSWFAFANGEGNTLYYQPGSLPEIYVFKSFEDTPHVWKLKPPPGYIEPPKTPLPEKDRYNRIKVDAYYNSYTQIRSFALLKGQMIVCWYHPDPERFYYQAYDTSKELLTKENLPVEGQLICSASNKLYTLLRADLDDSGENGKERVLVYESK